MQMPCGRLSAPAVDVDEEENEDGEKEEDGEEAEAAEGEEGSEEDGSPIVRT
jgi:hypothetical protein